MDVAERYGLDVDISSSSGTVDESKKIEGLKRFEKLFSSLTADKQDPNAFLPWLEGVAVFWATEIVYFTAWSWAKKQASSVGGDTEKDEDGGAMRKEFIPNWTNDEFIQFVNTLEGILNEGVEEAIGRDQEKKEEVVQRAEKKWRDLLAAEAAFWPEI